MKNWETLDADETLLLTKHFTTGRAGYKIDKIVLHHNAGNLSIRGCWDVWQTREASAHYQVQSDGRIGQLVWDTDTAWHAGNGLANQTSIGIEHADISSNPWRISDDCLDNGAHLVAALCKHYGLGRPQYGKNVFFHRDFYPTECPASIAGSQRDAYMRKCDYWYDQMIKGGNTMASSKEIWDYADDYGIKDESKGRMGARLSWIDKRVRELHAMLMQTSDKAADKTNGDLYTRMCWTDRRAREATQMLAQMQTQITALTAAVKALSDKQGLDATKVTEAIQTSVDSALKDLEIVLKTGD